MYLLDLFEEREGEKEKCDLVYGSPLDDRANGDYVDDLFTCGECGFSSLGSCSYFKEWVCNLGTKSMLHCVREVKCQQGDTPGI